MLGPRSKNRGHSDDEGDPMTFVELYAGLASVSLWLAGGHRPPVSRIGSKAGYARIIAKALDLEPGKVDRFLLVDTDPGICAVLRALTSPAGRAQVIGYLGQWAENRATWEAFRVAGTAESRSRRGLGHMEAARWLYVTAGARGGVGGFKGAHIHRPNVRGFIPSIAGLRERIAKLDLEPGRFEVHCVDAACVVPLAGAAVYLDPPYAGRQGYRASASLSDPVTILGTWAAAGARGALSEGRRLDIPGACVLDMTSGREGQTRRSLTTSASEYLHLLGG
jgi:hypothetical protein